MTLSQPLARTSETDTQSVASTNLEPILMTRFVGVRLGERYIVRDIDLSLYSNEILAIIGPSGCGKSTFISLPRGFHRIADVLPLDLPEDVKRHPNKYALKLLSELYGTAAAPAAWNATFNEAKLDVPRAASQLEVGWVDAQDGVD